MRKFLEEIVSKKTLNDAEIYSIVSSLKEGHLNDSQVSAFITAMHMKKVSPSELALFIEALSHDARAVDVKGAIDMASIHSAPFDIMTASAFIAAGADMPLIKQVYRSITSQFGSGDLLEALGINFSIPLEEQMEKTGVCFCFSPQFHPAVRHTMTARKSLGFYTFLDAAFALSHPFSVKKQVLYLKDPELFDLMRKAALILGDRDLLLILDAEEMLATEVHGKELNTYPLMQGEKEKKYLNLPMSIDAIEAILKGDQTPYSKKAYMLAAAGIYLSGKEDRWDKAHALVAESVSNGKVNQKFHTILELSKELLHIQ